MTGTTVGGFDREPTQKELTGGVLASGMATLVGSVFGVPAVSSYSQNVGIVSMTKVVSRRVITIASVIMLALGVVPKFSALVYTLPAPVSYTHLIRRFTLRWRPASTPSCAWARAWSSASWV